jgi:hypothetical protein
MVGTRYNDKSYYAVIRKDGNRWAADLYKDGELFYKSWQYNWRTRVELRAEISSFGIHYF